MAEGIPEYDELKLRIEPGGDGAYRVLAFGPDGTTASGEFVPPFSAMELDNFILRVGRPRRSVRAYGSSHMQEAKRFGSTLFDALLEGDVREAYLGARRVAEAHDRGLRVTLYMTGVPELMEIPWEFLYERPSFLSQSIYTPVVRSLDLKNVRRPSKVTPPLQILGVVSTPNGFEGLNVEEEQRKLEQALSSLRAAGMVELRWLARATMEELNRTVSAPDDIHVLHYIGHGAYDQRNDSGILVLENARGDPYEVSGEELGALLYDEHSLRLAVLNSCEGARTSHVEPFSGVAARLVEAGIPAVVGMQFEITDDAAVTFSERFYTSLAQGFPVDAALAQSRKAIFAAGSDIEFGTPVLFLRGAEAHVFDIEQGAAPPARTAATGPADFSVRLEQRPASTRPSQQATWELTVENTGACPLNNVTATGSDGRPLADPVDLDLGRRALVRWRAVLEPGLRQLVTVTASDPEGSRISEQVVAHPGEDTNSPQAGEVGEASDERRPLGDRRPGVLAGGDEPETSTPDRRVASGTAAPATPRRRSRSRRLVGLAAVATLVVGLVLLASLGAFSGDPDENASPDAGAIDGGGTVDALAAGAGVIVWERAVPGGVRLRVRQAGRTFDLPGPAAHDFAGIDVGTDASGRLVAIYSRCQEAYRCDIYRARVDTRQEFKATKLSKPECLESGPSIREGVVSFSRAADSPRCDAGVHVDIRGVPRYIPARQTGGTDTNGTAVAWAPKQGGELRIAGLNRHAKPQTIVPPQGHAFSRARLDGPYVYFVDNLLGRDLYFIARARRDSPQKLEHYGPGLSFRQSPNLAVSEGELFYSGDVESNRHDGPATIWHDRSPSFEKGLANHP